jgi:predicted ArsR family transcriptional regulator
MPDTHLGISRKTATCPTVGQVAKEIGIPKQTVSKHIESAATYAALKAYLEQRGGTVGVNKGGRPSKNKPVHDEQVSVASIAKELGIPRPTAVKHIKAAETYATLPKAIQEKVDGFERGGSGIVGMGDTAQH